MTKLKFSVLCECDSPDEVGKELAIFLQESWFNGDEVLEVDYNGYEVVS